MLREDAIIQLTGQALNGMLSSDTTIIEKLWTEATHKRIGAIAADIAIEAYNTIKKKAPIL